MCRGPVTSAGPMIQSSAIKHVNHCDLHNHVQPKLYTTSETMTCFLAAPYIMKTEERKNQRRDRRERERGRGVGYCNVCHLDPDPGERNEQRKTKNRHNHYLSEQTHFGDYPLILLLWQTMCHCHLTTFFLILFLHFGLADPTRFSNYVMLWLML